MWDNGYYDNMLHKSTISLVLDVFKLLLGLNNHTAS